MTLARKGDDPVEPRTGMVRVIFVRGGSRVMRADSFAEAAAKVKCASGAILCFVWSTPTQECYR